MSRRGLVALFAAAVGLAGAAGLFLGCFERRPVEVRRAGSPEARRNPFLAAERLLAAMGHAVRSVDGPPQLDPLPPTEATLIFTPNRRTLRPERSAALRAWVEAGGHLIVEAWELAGDEARRPDALLDPLGLEAHERSQDSVIEDWAEGRGSSDRSSLALPGAPAPLELRFDGRFVWSYRGEAPVRLAATGEAGDHLLQVELGRGRLTAVTDGAFLHNDALADLDHAEALLRLVRRDGHAGPVYIVTGERWPGLLETLGRHARPAGVAGALWLAAFLWRAASRRGPVLPPPPPERRSWLEHLDAVGRYHWRLDRGCGLRESGRRRLLQHLERAHPGWSRLSAAQQRERLAAATGLAPGEIAAALDPAGEDGEAAFVRGLRSQERIRSRT